MSDRGRMGSAHHYQGDAGRSYHHDKRRLPESAFDWVVALRKEKFDQHVRPDDTVVEFGVGAGWNLAGLDCRRRIGIDVADFLGDQVRERGIEFLGASNELADGIADVVICHHMLEHVTAPVEVLAEIGRVLRPGGTLLLHVPYEVQRKFRTYDRDEPNHHLYSWNVQTLSALVEECAFVVESADLGQYGYDRIGASLATQLRAGPRGFRALRKLAHLVRPVQEVRVVAVWAQSPAIA